MSKNINGEQGLARFDEVLSVYGADMARWPARERDALAALARDDVAAARMVSEAAALDKVLAFAPGGKASNALKNRIVAAAVADGAREAKVVPMSAARGNGRKGFGSGRETVWSATAMAACFALGLYLGVAGTGSDALGAALDIASADITVEEADSIDFLTDSDYEDSEGLI